MKVGWSLAGGIIIMSNPETGIIVPVLIRCVATGVYMRALSFFLL